ncbi:MAG: MerR family transcriptional regulator [Candidatus Omnitrophica bacterium]|nr:MerR family transcriptional regulator [Candidatus Omnitrophota bacterium]HOX54023.1 MerR family transcriptional regulator [Candidatus Omnitrophota bacterium]
MKNIYLIKDLSRRSGNSIHTIKYYLKIGLLHEIGRSPETNFRYFDDSSLEMLQQVRRLRQEGKSISEIKRKVSVADK